MGAWGRGPFDNDSACDWLSVAEELDDADEAIRGALEVALDIDYLEVDEGSAVVAAASVLAAALGKATLEGAPDAANELVSRLDSPGRLRALAVRALDRVLGKSSELAALWAEGDGNEWREATRALRDALAR